MTKAQVWLQLFTSVLQALVQSGMLQPHEAAAKARAQADEAMQHIHPSVFDIETNKVVPVDPLAGAVSVEARPFIEDELERARRQATPSGPTPAEQAEDDVSQATR